MAYELLSRNPKSGYFVLNFDTQSVKLGFKNWLKNAPILPISGGPVTFRPSLEGKEEKLIFVWILRSLAREYGWHVSTRTSIRKAALFSI